MSLPVPNPYVRSGPLLGPAWKHVETFDALPDASEGQEGEDEYEWDSEEEEVYVSLDLGSATDPLVIATSAEYQLIGLDSEHPFLKIGNHVFRGQPRRLIGSEIIFKDVRDAENTIKHTHHAIGSTQHVIQFEPVKLVPRERVQANSHSTTAGGPSGAPGMVEDDADGDGAADDQEAAGQDHAASSPHRSASAPGPSRNTSSPTMELDAELDINGLPVRKKARPGRKPGFRFPKPATNDVNAEATPTLGELVEGEAGPGPSTLSGRAQDEEADEDMEEQDVPEQTGAGVLSLISKASSATTPRGRGRGRGRARGKGPRGGRPRGSRTRPAQVLLDVEERMKAEEEMERDAGHSFSPYAQDISGHGGDAGEDGTRATPQLPPGSELPPGLQQMERSPSPDF